MNKVRKLTKIGLIVAAMLILGLVASLGYLSSSSDKLENGDSRARVRRMLWACQETRVTITDIPADSREFGLPPEGSVVYRYRFLLLPAFDVFVSYDEKEHIDWVSSYE